MTEKLAGDDLVRKFVNDIPVWEPDSVPFTRPKPLSKAKVAIVTAAGFKTGGGARAGFGKRLSPQQVPEAVEAFARIAGGTPFEKADIPGGDILAAAHDIRCYYEQAAMSLVDHVPAARQTQPWIFQVTETGKILRGAAQAMKRAGVPQPLWFYLPPSTHLG